MNATQAPTDARLRIGIDGYNLALQQGTGVATYGFTLSRVLREAGHRIDGVFGIDAGTDSEIRETLFFDRFGRAVAISDTQRRRNARHRNWIALNPWLRLAAIEIPLTNRVERAPLAERFPAMDRLITSPRLFDYAHRHFYYYGRFVPLRLPDPPQIMHWTYPIPIVMEGACNIYTLHDLVPLKLPFTTLDDKDRYRKLLLGCLRHAAHICTVSETSRNDILDEFDLAPNMLSNCYQSVMPPETWRDEGRARDAQIVESTLGLKAQNYFLFFGAIEPKKNVGRLIEAFLSINTATSLVIAGPRGWQSDDQLALLTDAVDNQGTTEYPIAERVIYFEHLPRNLLLRLIRGARAVLFPSLYEGFGLPVLEALQMGTPVLTSRTGALPEIGGDAAIYIDPYDTRDIAFAIERLDRDAALREQLAAAALTQAARFSASVYLNRLQTMYAAAANGRS